MIKIGKKTKHIELAVLKDCFPKSSFYKLGRKEAIKSLEIAKEKFKKEDCDGAIKYAELAKNQDPKFAEASLLLGQVTNNMGMCRMLEENTGEKLRGGKYETFRKLKSLVVFNIAISDFKDAIKLKPGYVKAYKERAFAYENMDEYKKALNDYNQAIKHSIKEDPDLYNSRGYVKKLLNDYKGAIKDLSRAIKMEPKNFDPLEMRALVYVQMGAYSNAERDYGALIAIRPKHWYYFYCRGGVRMKLKDYISTIEDFNFVIKHRHKHCQSFYFRGMAKKAMKDLKGAKRDFENGSSYRCNNKRILNKCKKEFMVLQQPVPLKTLKNPRHWVTNRQMTG